MIWHVKFGYFFYLRGDSCLQLRGPRDAPISVQLSGDYHLLNTINNLLAFQFILNPSFFFEKEWAPETEHQ